MQKIKPELVATRERRSVVLLSETAHHQGLVKANRFILLLASSVMVLVFLLGFLISPATKMLDQIKQKKDLVSTGASSSETPGLSAEINTLKGQLVGLVSGSIESKLRILEESIRTGKVTRSLGTIQDLKNDVKILQSYSTPRIQGVVSNNEALIKEVSHLKSLIYLTLTSCGLMIAAIGGLWVRKHYFLSRPQVISRAELGKHK